ncbi:hypothetical protein Hanom_Chr11g01015271 [Helianthus anomalus]
MKNKGKCVGGISDVSERSTIPAIVYVSPDQNPCPVSAVSAIFEEDVLLDDIIEE